MGDRNSSYGFGDELYILPLDVFDDHDALFGEEVQG